MTLPERIHDRLLHTYCNMVMPLGTPGGRVLIPANMGFGDLVFYLPVLRALDNKGNTLIVDDDDKRDFLRMAGISNCWIHHTDRISFGNYDTVVCHHVQQWTPIIYQIIEKRIPCRIGHIWRQKYSWLWTHKVPYIDLWHERTNNAWLLKPFHLEPIYKKIEIANHQRFDVLIAPNTTSPEKDWQGFGELIGKLHFAGYAGVYIGRKWQMENLLRTVASTRLVIGNDSGLPKIADAMGVPAIQIFKKTGWPPSRAGLTSGVDLVEPTVEEVFNRAQTILRNQ